RPCESISESVAKSQFPAPVLENEGNVIPFVLAGIVDFYSAALTTDTLVPYLRQRVRFKCCGQSVSIDLLDLLFLLRCNAGNQEIGLLGHLLLYCLDILALDGRIKPLISGCWSIITRRSGRITTAGNCHHGYEKQGKGHYYL